MPLKYSRVYDLSVLQGVTVPQRQPEVAPARFGFVDNAERINSRACMVRTVALCRTSLSAWYGMFIEAQTFTCRLVYGDCLLGLFDAALQCHLP